MITFEEGQTYFARAATDHDFLYYFRVEKVTAKKITGIILNGAFACLTQTRKTFTLRTNYERDQFFTSKGSLAPVFSSRNKVKNLADG